MFELPALEAQKEDWDFFRDANGLINANPFHLVPVSLETRSVSSTKRPVLRTETKL